MAPPATAPEGASVGGTRCAWISVVELVNNSGQLGVGVSLQLPGDEVVVGFGLLEGGLSVLPDHDNQLGWNACLHCLVTDRLCCWS